MLVTTTPCVCSCAYARNHLSSSVSPDQSFFLSYRRGKVSLSLHLMTEEMGVRDRIESKVHHFSGAMSFSQRLMEMYYEL